MISLVLLPVIAFLILLLLLDSFKLIKLRTLIISGIWGLIAAWLALIINVRLMCDITISFNDFSKYMAPPLEELLKVSLFLYLIKKGNIGFMIDGAIYGFCTGAFFSVFENINYFYAFQDQNPMVWVLRGFGTALMHGGTTAIILMFAMGSLNRHNRLLLSLFEGYLIAVIIHSAFNHLMLISSPLWVVISVLVGLPALIFVVFLRNELGLRKWLDVELSEEVRLLKMMREGKLSNTKTGEYILSIRKNFSPEVILDMMNYLRIYTELSLHAKKLMMLKEAGLPLNREKNVPGLLKELKSLKKEIGKTGIIAISPVLRMSQKDVWKLNLLES